MNEVCLRHNAICFAPVFFLQKKCITTIAYVLHNWFFDKKKIK